MKLVHFASSITFVLNYPDYLHWQRTFQTKRSFDSSLLQSSLRAGDAAAYVSTSSRRVGRIEKNRFPAIFAGNAHHRILLPLLATSHATPLRQITTNWHYFRLAHRLACGLPQLFRPLPVPLLRLARRSLQIAFHQPLRWFQSPAVQHWLHRQ